MTVWSYRTPTGRAYGCPVTVSLPGWGWIQVAYQFQGGGQGCAVVDVTSGQVIAPVFDRHEGYPQQRAQAAVDEQTADMDPEKIRGALIEAPTLNRGARVE